MVGISRISTYGILSGNLQNLRSQQEIFSFKASQLNTGKKFSTLIEYRQEITQLLTFQQDIDRKTATINRLTLTETVIRTYDATLEGFDDKIDILLRTIEDSRGFSSDASPDLYERWREQHSEYFDNFLREINDLFNTRVGRRYIYAGSAYNVRPIRDLSAETLPAAPALPTAFTLNPTNQVPIYATLPTTPANDDRLSDRQFIHLDEAGVTYGESFTHQGFQRLIQGFFDFKTSLSRSDETQRIAFINQAEQLLKTAKNDLQVLREREAFNLQIITQAQRDTRNEKTLQENFLASITQINPEEVVVEISAIRNQIEASFRTINVQNSLSIANFLFG